MSEHIWKSRRVQAATVATVAALALGETWGLAVESHTNDVAKRKIVTAESCLAGVPHDQQINQALVDCLHAGVPGGAPIKDLVDNGFFTDDYDNDFKVGQPINFVDGYIASQRTEAAHLEAGRLIAWPLAPFGVAVVATTCVVKFP